MVLYFETCSGRMQFMHRHAEYHLYYNWSAGHKVKDIRYGKKWQAPTLDELGEAFETLMLECKEEFNDFVPKLFDEIQASVWKWMLTDNERMHLNSAYLHWQYVSKIMHRSITDTRSLIDMEVSDPEEKIVIQDLVDKLMEITDNAIQVVWRRSLLSESFPWCPEALLVRSSDSARGSGPLRTQTMPHTCDLGDHGRIHQHLPNT
jgi:hypothetical protein